jgi:penicillin amidase
MKMNNAVLVSLPSLKNGWMRRTWIGRPVKWLVWIFAALVLLVVTGLGAGTLWLRSAAMNALAVMDGDLKAAGLTAPVVVKRDGHGVPHIEAANEGDLFFAQGYVTAQERLWQMDLYRRLANGELAEILGPKLVEHDKMQRVLGIRRGAERVYKALPEDERGRMEQYARGVNAYIEQNRKKLPPEFALLHYEPKPWHGEDCLSVGMMMVQDLDTHWQTKLSREAIVKKLNDAALEADLYPEATWRDHPPTGVRVDMTKDRPKYVQPEDSDEDDSSHAKREDLIGPMRELAAEQKDFEAALGIRTCTDCAWGSNNWVVSGAHTASGKPLLSNDMHLALTLPSIWFMVDLKAPGYHVAGVALPGMPYVIVGHNEHVAWGITSLYADVQDLYLEKLDGKGNFESVSGEWKPLDVEEEVIHVRWGSDVKVRVERTEHGPLLNLMLKKETRPIALKWTVYDESLHDLPIYQLNKAANWAEFSAGLKAWCWPTQNMVYADDQGHIAYHAVGKIPLRLNERYQYPLPEISKVSLEWGILIDKTPTTYIPYDDLPNAFDPPSGFLATANSNVTTEKTKYKLSAETADPYRAERIYKMLDGRDGLTAKDMLAAQTDLYSEVDQELGHRFAYAIDHTPNATAQEKQAAELMRSWDGRVTTGSAAASVVTKTRDALWPLILEPKLGELAKDYTWSEKNFALEEIVMHAKAAWLPKKYANWDALITAAVAEALKESPANVNDWNYGSWHTINMDHPLANFLPLLSKVAGTGKQPNSGDMTTVKQAHGISGPSQRFTMDWNDVDGSTENITLGESGNPLSPYFKDQWNDWQKGTSFALPFTDAAVNQQATHRLRLVP